ncbi:MAG TPA: VOC family protein [Rhodopila sp.]|nr:VOC family protein [Rhodopila sp.]
MLQVPEATWPPPFRITRASHLVYTVRDIARSRAFYTEVLGLVVSDEDRNTLYLRGVEERSHHSLVLKRTDSAPACIRAGLRTFGDEDLEKARFFFEQRGMKAEFIEVPYQSRTLHTTDIAGTPLELCASIPRTERVDQNFESLRGAGALRFDHYQITAPDIQTAACFYAELGFRVVDYMMVSGAPVGIFLHVKDSMYDVVFIRRPGPALHHYGHIVGGINDIIRACDVAGRMGYGDHVEFGPSRHSLGHSYYVYLLDPDGHRVELLPPPIYYGDADDGPVIHDLTGVRRVTESWGLPPRLSWLKNASPFEGVPCTSPRAGGPEPSLEAYLGMT